MSPKITSDHLARAAIVYVRQSTMAQVVGNLESQRRQYDLASAAGAAGFASVRVIDDDLGRSGSGSVERPGFERLVAMVCSGDVGAVYCIEASRLARNGRDWHHLIELCALAGTLVIDPEGAYDPRIVNDRLLLGLKGTMAEYELSLMRQRGLAARDSKARRGEFQFMLPPGFCSSEAGKIEIDPDEHMQEAVRMVFAKFHELGSARQVFLWLRSAEIKLPVVRRNIDVYKVVWKAPSYHAVMQILHNPLYAGAYAFGKNAQRTRIVDGRARKVSGFRKPREEWTVLLRDNHAAYISWREYEDNQKLLLENVYMKRNCARKSARGGRALLTGLMRCGRCGRMMRVFYGMGKGHAHRYQCRGDDAHVGAGLCIGAGGVRVDRAVALQLLEAVSDHAVEAAIFATDQIERSTNEIIAAAERDLEAARYEAGLAARRHELVDPAKRFVARELEARWNGAPEKVVAIERRRRRSPQDRPRGLDAARPGSARGLECADDGHAHQAASHSYPDPRDRLRPRRCGQRGRIADPLDRRPVQRASRAAGEDRLRPDGRGADRGRGDPQARQPLVRSRDRRVAQPHALQDRRGRDLGVRVRAMRERLGIPERRQSPDDGMISLAKAAERLKICVGSAKRLVDWGILPATQLIPGSTWLVPSNALDTPAIQQGAQDVIARRPKNYSNYQYDKVVRLPGLSTGGAS
ncbi:MAG TPA: recombinase family protein [Roseiarcus sp.]|jgi:DNA invertase Pin-like site-specific DNA recombinase|nr:recombinase family protein [Roseiarcus sp.]